MMRTVTQYHSCPRSMLFPRSLAERRESKPKMAAPIFILFFFLNMQLILPSAFANEKCHKDVCFDAVKKIGEQEIPLRGLGLLEYLFFDLYNIAVYVPESVKTIEDIEKDDVPRAIEIAYLRGIKAKQIIKAANKIMAKDPDVDIEALQSRLDQINEPYENVQKGDRYLLTYEPGVGTKLIFNGREDALIPGADFANAYFGMWIGSHPANEDLRDELIGFKDRG